MKVIRTQRTVHLILSPRESHTLCGKVAKSNVVAMQYLRTNCNVCIRVHKKMMEGRKNEE